MSAPPPVIAKVTLAITVKNNATLHSSLCELPPAHSAKEVWTTFPLIKARKHHYCCGDSSLRFHFNGVIQSTSLAPSKSWKACSKECGEYTTSFILGLHEMTLHDCCHRWWGLRPWNRQWYSGVVLHIQKAVGCRKTVQSEHGYISRFVSCSDKKWHQTTVPSVWCHNWFAGFTMVPLAVSALTLNARVGVGMGMGVQTTCTVLFMSTFVSVDVE